MCANSKRHKTNFYFNFNSYTRHARKHDEFYTSAYEARIIDAQSPRIFGPLIDSLYMSEGLFLLKKKKRQSDLITQYFSDSSCSAHVPSRP